MPLDARSEIAHLQGEMNRAGLILSNDHRVQRSGDDKTRLGREFMALSPRFAALGNLVGEMIAEMQEAMPSLSPEQQKAFGAILSRAAGIAPGGSG